MDEPGTRAGERLGDVGPGVSMTAPAGFDDGQGGGIGGAALFVASAETQAASDHRDAQGSLGLIVRRGQMGIADEGDYCRPVVEDFAGERADFLGFVIPMEFAGALQPGLDRIEDRVPLVLGDGVDQTSQFADHPVSEADPVGSEAAGQCNALADQVSIMPMSA